MRKIRDVLRLNAEGLSNRKIAVSLGIGRTTIGDTVRRAQLAGLNWPLPSDLTDDALEQRLFPVVVKAKNPSLPDWAYIHRERRRPGVTLLLLWEEYRSAHPDGFGRTQFYAHYRQWQGKLSPTMRQTHTAGERIVKRHLLLRVKATPSVTRTARFGGRTPPSSRHDGLLHRASHRTGHADHASGSLDWSIKMPAQAGQIPAGC